MSPREFKLIPKRFNRQLAPTAQLDVTDCDIKSAVSSAVSWNMKSAGKLRLTAEHADYQPRSKLGWPMSNVTRFPPFVNGEHDLHRWLADYKIEPASRR